MEERKLKTSKSEPEVGDADMSTRETQEMRVRHREQGSRERGGSTWQSQTEVETDRRLEEKEREEERRRSSECCEERGGD